MKVKVDGIEFETRVDWKGVVRFVPDPLIFFLGLKVTEEEMQTAYYSQWISKADLVRGLAGVGLPVEDLRKLVALQGVKIEYE